jgi:DUF4097 and DUF4098 domain-containing protein YvlB
MQRVLTIVAGILLVGLRSDSVSAQEFQKTYNVQAGAVIRVENVSGDIRVTGYDGSAIEVKGFKEGRDKDLIDVEDTSTADSVTLKVRYPHNGNCDASIRFELLVPRSTRYQFDRLSTASGDISVKDIAGRLKIDSASGEITVDRAQGDVQASTASGDMRVKGIKGTVNANSASGDVEVEIVKLEGTSQLKVSTASGDVSLRLPPNPDVEIDMSTVSGSLHTDFPIEIHTPEHGPGQSAHGRMGSGTFQLKASTVSGDINLQRI